MINIEYDAQRTGADTVSRDRQRRVLAVTAYRFPSGDAMSNRALNLIRSAGAGGTTPLVVNAWPNDGSDPTIAQAPKGVELVTLHRGKRGRIGRFWERITRPLSVVATARERGIRRGDVAAVLIPHGLITLISVVVYRAAFGSRLVVDVTERHDAAQFDRGRLEPYFIRHQWSTYLTRSFADRAIVVSSRLGDMYGRKTPVFVVPPQVDCAEFSPPNPPSITSRVRLLYAGSPGRKDKLNVLLDAIGRLSAQDQQRIELVVAGLTAAQATAMSDINAATLGSVANRVTFVGRVARTEVLSLLSQCHFSVLIRPTGGYADMGFPSKVPESLAAGCPVLLNATSDLSRYVSNGREGIVITGDNTAAVRQGLNAVLALDDSTWRQMSHSARACAERNFDYRTTDQLADFVTGA